MQPKKILLIDDSKFFIELEKNVLQGFNYQFLEAHDGQEGLNVAKAEHPDLILLDINMPVMNGIQFLEVLRETAEIKAIPVIVVTTKGKSADVQEAFQAGANDYISKPIDDIGLQLKVQAQLDPLKIRVSPRLQVHLPINFFDFQNHYQGMAQDISTGGMHFHTTHNLQLYQKIEIYFTLGHDNQTREFRLFGQVVGISESMAEPTAGAVENNIHLQFLNMSWDDFSFLDHLINMDIESVATFLLSSSNQRSDPNPESLPVRDEIYQSLADELDRMLNSYADTAASTQEFEGKYSVLIKHLKDLQLDFRNLTLTHAKLREQYINTLVLLIVSKQLHQQRTLQGMIKTICDICENMLGADTFDLCGFDFEQGGFFSLLTGENMPHDFIGSLPEQALKRNELYVKEPPDDDKAQALEGPLALIPLTARGAIIGCIVINSLLPQRKTFSHVSLQLIDLLHKQAGMALFGCMHDADSSRIDEVLLAFSTRLRDLT